VKEKIKASQVALQKPTRDTVSYAKEKIKASQGKRGGPSYAKEKIKASLSIPCFT